MFYVYLGCYVNEDEIRTIQLYDAAIYHIKQDIVKGKAKCFSLDDQGTVFLKAA
jgi:hypothetical protein